jgi:hypothetical protein
MIENEYRQRSKRGFEKYQRIRDITMAILITGMAIVLFFGVQWQIPQIVALDETNSTFRYIMAGLFALYGLFRLYRGIKREN